MAINCVNSVEGEGCGDCASCRRLLDGNSPDFLIIASGYGTDHSEIQYNPSVSSLKGGGNILIDQIRELNRLIGFPPLGKYRISVIRGAEAMTQEAANSFLKTLEEPPPGNLFILNVTEPFDLMPTIVSRCQRVPFRPLSVNEITDYLVKKRGLSEETAMMLARISAGSLGRAILMGESSFVERREEWLGKLVSLSGLSRDEAFEIALETGDEVRKFGLNVSADGTPGLLDMLAVWESWYRDMLVLTEKAPIDLIINVDFTQVLRKRAGDYTMDQLLHSLFLLEQAEDALKANRNVALVMEHVVFSLWKTLRCEV